MGKKVQSSETITENIFRSFYGPDTFIEKSAIDKSYGFKSKNGTSFAGYPDFFLDLPDFAIIVEAKPLLHSRAEEEVKFYMTTNNIKKNMVGIAVSGRELSQIKVTYFFKKTDSDEIEKFNIKDKLLTLENIGKALSKRVSGETISDEQLVSILKSINEKFHDGGIKDTYRSLFFSGIMIALTNTNFRSIYLNIQEPTDQEIATTSVTILNAHYMNKSILQAVDTQLGLKVNNLSKEFSWRDQFSFIKNIDLPLLTYKQLISQIHNKIFIPYQYEEKQDILGKAYKIFLSRAGKIENKNIILTPDHIKELMVKLARLNVNDVVIDTCTGSGGFLMEAMETLYNLAKDDEDKLEEIRNRQLIGFEIDPVLFSLACSNMFLHGDGRSNMLFRNSLLNVSDNTIMNNKDDVLLEYIREKKPTKCIINPPYENKNPIKFTLQAIDYLENNGKLIIIMPSPTLTKNQGKDGTTGLTDLLLEKARLDYVIKMPLSIFREQGRTVNTSIFGFTKTPHNPTDEVLFYNLEDDGLVSVQHKGRIDKNNRWNDIENQIVDSINNSKEIQGISEKKKIYKEGVLNAAGYQNEDGSHHKLVKFKELFSSTKGELASTNEMDDGEYDFITASDEWKKYSSYTHDEEALVYAVSASGSLGKSQYVNGKFIASNLCLVLTPKNYDKYPINMKFYNWYFEAIRKKVVADLADGTSKLTINPGHLNEYFVEYFPIEEQNAFVNEYIVKYDELKKQVQRAERDLKINLRNFM
ncbi:N-6 DNA methylase [Lactococcus muris]|uniref:N-6 DNA methylase n=1 Tax=Lactococcus muris TaxID=2941330 RepID=UPI0023009BBD